MTIAAGLFGWLSHGENPLQRETRAARSHFRSTGAAGGSGRARPLDRDETAGAPAGVGADAANLAAPPVSGRQLVATSRVQGAAVFSADGQLEGHIGELSIDKASGCVVYALLRFGGFLGYAERFRPLPWSLLSYDWEKHGYVIPFDDLALDEAPEFSARELHRFGVGDDPWREAVARYYAPYIPVPYP